METKKDINYLAKNFSQFRTNLIDFAKQYLIRDTYCSHCKSVTIERFHSDSSYDSEWIDLNEQHRKE